LGAYHHRDHLWADTHSNYSEPLQRGVYRNNLSNIGAYLQIQPKCYRANARMDADKWSGMVYSAAAELNVDAAQPCIEQTGPAPGGERRDY